MNRVDQTMRPDSGTSSPSTANLPVLNDGSGAAIHDASLDVLEHTGYHVPVEEARKLLVDAGAVADGERVCIPAVNWLSRHSRQLARLSSTTGVVN